MPKRFLPEKAVKIFFILVLICILFFLGQKFISVPLRYTFYKLTYPFEKMFYVSGRTLRSTFDFFGSIYDLKNENARLLKENNLLISEITGLKELEQENKILREQLNLLPLNKFSLENCFVIGENPQGGGWILIDKGNSKGIKAGMPVIVSNGMLVGKIEEVYADSSKVKLITDSTSAINAVDTETQAKGIVKGEYGLGIVMDMISQSDSINAGDAIITSGLGGDIPKGLFIGNVQEVKNSSDKLFQEALIIPKAKLSSLEIVSVIKGER